MAKPVTIYIGLTYLVTWGTTLLFYFLYTSGMISLNELNLYYNIGALGPFISAVIAARSIYGKEGLAKLLGTFRLKGLRGASLFLSLSPLIFLVIGFITYPLYKGRMYSFSDTREQFNLYTTTSYLAWILPFITYSIFEEFGWRGFLLPHLQGRYPALKSTLVLTVVWATWHLPFFLWRFDFSLFITIGFFFSIFIGSVLLTSTFNLSRGSIVSTILFHFCNNIASALDKEYIVAVVSTGFVLVAARVLVKYKGRNLCTGERVKNFYLD